MYWQHVSIGILTESLSLQKWRTLVAIVHFGALNLSKSTVMRVPKSLLYAAVDTPILSHCQQKHPQLSELRYLNYWSIWIRNFQILQLVVFFGILLQLHIFKSGFLKFIIQLWLTCTSPSQIVSTSIHTFFKCNSSAFLSELVGKVNGLCHCSSLIIWLLLAGLRHLKEIQDAELAPALHYIRDITEVPLSNMPAHEEDDSNETASGEPLRMIICMSKESSRRLLAAQYLQSDISFKRVAGFLEFVIGGWNQNAKIGP